MLNLNESELLSSYLDDQISRAEKKRVEEMLANSIEWREELETLKRSKMLLMSLPKTAAPADLLAQLHEMANQLPAAPSFWEKLTSMLSPTQTWLVGSMATAALAVAVLVGVQHANKPQPIPLSALMAAHQQGLTTASFPQNVVSASLYSKQMQLMEQHESNEAKI